jgi:hypothetical protein
MFLNWVETMPGEKNEWAVIAIYTSIFFGPAVLFCAIVFSPITAPDLIRQVKDKKNYK